eukprot:1289123-Rhodomonas_salina.4
MLGSPYYVAPEVLGASKDKGYGKACDIWSIGVLLRPNYVRREVAVSLCGVGTVVLEYDV